MYSNYFTCRKYIPAFEEKHMKINSSLLRSSVKRLRKSKLSTETQQCCRINTTLSHELTLRRATFNCLPVGETTARSQPWWGSGEVWPVVWLILSSIPCGHNIGNGGQRCQFAKPSDAVGGLTGSELTVSLRQWWNNRVLQGFVFFYHE